MRDVKGLSNGCQAAVLGNLQATAAEMQWCLPSEQYEIWVSAIKTLLFRLGDADIFSAESRAIVASASSARRLEYAKK